MMFRKSIYLLLILCPIATYGQFGVNIKYLFGQSENLDNYNLSQDGLHASLEYGFRLKKKRLEFHPGLGYRYTFNQDAYNGSFNSIDLDLNTSIYPFDFGGDCDCPTFSKDGNVIKKGFFIEVAPGLGYQTLHREYNFPHIDPPNYSDVSSNLVWKLSIGAGIDLGLSKELTVTPTFSWTRISTEEWNSLYELEVEGTLDDQTYLAAGLRLTYKPDPKRRRRF